MPDSDEGELDHDDYRRLQEHLSLSRLSLDPVPRIVTELDAVSANGGCVLIGLSVEDPDAICEYFEASNMSADNTEAFFTAVLTSDAINDALPALETRDGFGGSHETVDFEWLYPTKVDGHVAWLLVRGGAYDSFDGSAAEAKEMGRAFFATLCDDRYEDLTVRRSTTQWSDWFQGTVHWDETLCLFDEGHNRIWVCLFTDTD